MGMTLSIVADGAPGGSAAAGSHSGGASHNHEVATGRGIPTADQLRAYAAKVDPYPAEVAPASEEKDHYYTLVARDDIEDHRSGANAGIHLHSEGSRYLDVSLLDAPHVYAHC